MRYLIVLLLACRAFATIGSSPLHTASGVIGSGNSTGTFTITTPTQGNILLLLGNGFGGTAQYVSAVATTNVTWTNISSGGTSSNAPSLWCGAVGASPGTSVAVMQNAASTANNRYLVFEWTGAQCGQNDASPVLNSTTTGTTTFATGSITPTAGQNVLLIFIGSSAGWSGSPSNGFLTESPSGNNFAGGYLVVSSASGAYSSTWTQSNGVFGNVIAEFTAPSAAPSAVPAQVY